MSNQTEREKLLKLASDIDCDSTKLVSLDVAEINAVVAALRFQANALDGGAVSQKPLQCLICGAKHSGWSKADLEEWQKLISPLRHQGRHPYANERIPRPQTEARDFLIRFATWFDRCSERPLHAHEISDSIDAFLATQDNPCWTDDQIARGVDKAFDRLVSAPQPDEGRDLRLIAFVRHPQKCEWGLGREGDKQALDSFLAAEKEPRE